MIYPRRSGVKTEAQSLQDPRFWSNFAVTISFVKPEFEREPSGWTGNKTLRWTLSGETANALFGGHLIKILTSPGFCDPASQTHLITSFD